MSSKNEDIVKELEDLLLFDNEEERIELEAELLNLQFVKLIEDLMKREGITKTEIAEELSTSKSYITQLFSGSKLLNMKTLAKIQRVLGFNFKIEIDNKNRKFKAVDLDIFKKSYDISSSYRVNCENRYYVETQGRKLKLIA